MPSSMRAQPSRYSHLKAELGFVRTNVRIQSRWTLKPSNPKTCHCGEGSRGRMTSTPQIDCGATQASNRFFRAETFFESHCFQVCDASLLVVKFLRISSTVLSLFLHWHVYHSCWITVAHSCYIIYLYYEMCFACLYIFVHVHLSITARAVIISGGTKFWWLFLDFISVTCLLQAPTSCKTRKHDSSHSPNDHRKTLQIAKDEGCCKQHEKSRTKTDSHLCGLGCCSVEN